MVSARALFSISPSSNPGPVQPEGKPGKMQGLEKKDLIGSELERP
jgi:hypothetical protein